MPLIMRVIEYWNGRGRFLVEAVVWWLVISLPINMVSILFASQAPPYVHSDEDTYYVGYGYNSISNTNQSILDSSSATEAQPGGDSSSNNSDVRQSIGSKSPTKKEFNQSMYCYEDSETDNQLLVNCDFWVSGVGMLSVGIGGIIGNVLTMLALASESKESRNSFNKLLIYMTVVDTLLIIACVTEFSVFNIFWGHQPHWFIAAFPYFIHPFKQILLSMCIFTMVAVSSERCQAICHPIRTRPSPGEYMITVAILSVSLNARKFFEFQHSKDGMDYETTSLMEYPPYIIFSNTWQEMVVTGAMPFIVLLICNIKIYLKIRESSKHENHRFLGKVTTTKQSQHTAETAEMTELAAIIDSKMLESQQHHQPHTNKGGSSQQERTPIKAESSKADIEQCNNDDDTSSMTSLFEYFRGKRTGSYYKAVKSQEPANNAARKPKASISRPETPSTYSVANLANNANLINNKKPLSHGQKKLKKRHEKSVVILCLIVAVFVLCHSFRLGVQSYQTLHSYQSTKEHFIFCQRLNRLPYPVTFLILITFNNLFLVFNSSINFIVYCAVRKSFRERILWILKQPFVICVRTSTLNTRGRRSPTTMITNTV